MQIQGPPFPSACAWPLSDTQGRLLQMLPGKSRQPHTGSEQGSMISLARACQTEQSTCAQRHPDMALCMIAKGTGCRSTLVMGTRRYTRMNRWSRNGVLTQILESHAADTNHESCGSRAGRWPWTAPLCRSLQKAQARTQMGARAIGVATAQMYRVSADARMASAFVLAPNRARGAPVDIRLGMPPSWSCLSRWPASPLGYITASCTDGAMRWWQPAPGLVLTVVETCTSLPVSGWIVRHAG